MKRLFIIAGPNGAGKTTASFSILPELLDCQEFVNADEIARGLSPLNPDDVAFTAGRIMLERINELLCSGEDFALETTLASKSLLPKITKAILHHYTVTIIFFHLKSPALAKSRVKTRVREGGHNIPEEVIVRRYGRGLVNFFRIYRHVVNDWVFVENSGKPYRVIATKQKSRKTELIENHELWHNLKEQYDE